MKAIKVSMDGTIEQVDVPGGWEGVVGVLGGFMEVIRRSPRDLLGGNAVMVVDEEGRYKPDLSVNPVGSVLYGSLVHGQPIVGDVLIMGEEMTMEGADFCDLSDPEGVEVALRRILAHLP